METPVLTQSEKSKALSGNKSKQKKKSTKIRNVLANYTSRSSIKLSDQDSITLEERLSEVFYHAIPKKPKWDEVKKIPKEKRAEFRATLQKQKNPLTRNLIFGINEVTRAIEKQSCTLVLITNDINPAILMRHIHEGCSTHQIPLFEVIDLRNISQKCFGFPTIAMAFKNIPDDLMIVKEFFVSVAPEIIHSINNNIINKSSKVTPKRRECPPENKEIKLDVDTTSVVREVYLFRESTKIRCFVPPTSDLKSHKSVPEIQPSMDFIEFASDGEKTNKLYKNLKVKRIRPNPNRIKGKKKL